MGANHSSGNTESATTSAGQSQTTMSNSEEMANDDSSEFSMELGEPYDRIEYPPEVYDRVCGRLPLNQPPLEKKEKVDDWLSTSQSTFNEREVSSPGRKRKKKQLENIPPVARTKEPVTTGKKISRKSLDLRRTKRKLREVAESEDGNSDEIETEEEEDYSEIDSSPEKKKKKKKINDTKMRKVEKKTKEEKSYSKVIEKRERKEIGVKKEKKDKLKGNEDGEQYDAKRNEKKEGKEKDLQNDPPRNNEEKSHSKRDESKEEKEKREKRDPSDGKDSSMEGKKTSDYEVPSNPNKPGNRREVVSSSSSHSSAALPPPPPPPLKSILKKTFTKTISSGNSMLPSCMQELFNETPSPSAAAASEAIAQFKVPKRKDAGDDHLNKKKSVTPTEVVRPEDRGEGGTGWDPRNAAFVPPPRNFGKPPKPVVDRRRTTLESEVPERKPFPVYSMFPRPAGYVMSPRPALLPTPILPPTSHYDSQSEYESWERNLKKEHRERSRSPERSRDRSPKKSTERTPSSSRNSHWSTDEEVVSPRDRPTSSLSRSTPSRWNSQREAEHSMVHSPSAWTSFDSTESAESARKGKTSRWDEYPRVKMEVMEQSPIEPMNMPVSPLSPLSPPPFTSSSFDRRLSLDSAMSSPIPAESGNLVPYRFIPIDDDCLPPWNRSDRYKSASAIYSPVQRCRAIVVAGFFPEWADKKAFEKLMKSKEAEVEWTEAPATKDTVAKKQRSIAAVLCNSEATAKELVADRTMKVESFNVSFGKPLEVMVKVEGITSKMDEKELIEEMTDAIETNIGGLVELLLFRSSNDLVVEGKARFFYEVHGTRAANRAPLSLDGGRSITFSPCPPDKSTTWMAAILGDSSAAGDLAMRFPTAPRPIPLSSLSTAFPAGPQPVPPPSIVSLSGFPLKTPKIEPGTTVSRSAISTPSMSMDDPCDPHHSFSHRHSKFSPLPPPTALPPPGLVDPSSLHITTRADLYEQTISIPAISVPAGIIPMPPARILPPVDIKPVLPHPDLPQIEHQFFPSPVDRRRGGGGDNRQMLMNVDPATFIRPFQALLPKEEKIEDEILLYARCLESEDVTDWDAVREYFKDDDCSSRVYGGIVSLRFTGDRAKEKAQVLLLDAPHTVNEQKFSIGLTFSVLYEASKAVGKTRLYEELMERYGSVVEVEKKCDTPIGKPVYKIYFDTLEMAKTAAMEGITVGESTLTNIGRIPE